MEFLDLKKNTGKEELRARDLFYALWIPDLFMKRVEKNEKWSLMCPHDCPGLSDVWGEEFEKLYTKYVFEICSIFFFVFCRMVLKSLICICERKKNMFWVLVKFWLFLTYKLCSKYINIFIVELDFHFYFSVV